MTNRSTATLDERSLALRRSIVNTLVAGGRGHLGAAFSLVEILRVLYDDWLNYRADDPGWPDRDRLILSKGHGCLALYVLLAEKGFFPVDELKTFCAFNSRLGGHPETIIPGVEASTGSLGHGLAIGVGMAIAIRGASSRIAVILGDGECDEGSVWEAAMLAAKHRLDNLVAIIDYNKHQSYGATGSVMELEPFTDKWRSFGFAVEEVDGHDVAGVKEAIESLPYGKGKPSALICHTVKGRGIPFTENNLSWHHKSGMKEEEVESLMRALGDGS